MEPAENEEVDPRYLAPLASSSNVPTVTAPADTEDEAEDGNMPGLETADPSSDEEEPGPSRPYVYVEPDDQEVNRWLSASDSDTEDTQQRMLWILWTNIMVDIGLRI